GNGGGQDDGNQGGGQDDGNQDGGQNDGNQDGGQNDGDQGGGQEPPVATEEPADDKGAAQPDVKISDPADAGGKDDAQGGADKGEGGDDGGQAAQAAQVPGSLPELEDNTQAQGAGGSLAETGAQMWPAAIGGVLVIFGFFVLRSVRRNA
ncbi:hypothetical protein ACFUVU_32850, partial [Streptomyces griseoincarnatus]